MKESLPKTARKLEKYIYTLPAARKLNMLAREPRQAMISLRDSATAARQGIESYVGSDDTTKQSLALQESIEQLTKVKGMILMASSHDLLDITDVAHLSALTEHIIEQLK